MAQKRLFLAGTPENHTSDSSTFPSTLLPPLSTLDLSSRHLVRCSVLQEACLCVPPPPRLCPGGLLSPWSTAPVSLGQSCGWWSAPISWLPLSESPTCSVPEYSRCSVEMGGIRPRQAQAPPYLVPSRVRGTGPDWVIKQRFGWLPCPHSFFQYLL